MGTVVLAAHGKTSSGHLWQHGCPPTDCGPSPGPPLGNQSRTYTVRHLSQKLKQPAEPSVGFINHDWTCKHWTDGAFVSFNYAVLLMCLNQLIVTENVSVEPTLINNEAKFLNCSEVSTDSVKAINFQTWKKRLQYMKQDMLRSGSAFARMGFI